MGQLKETIVFDKNMAMKMRDTKLANILRTIIGELDRLTDDKGFPIKDPSDALVVRTIKKTVEANTEFNINEFETQVLSQYLPKTLSEIELSTIINNQIAVNGYCTMRDLGRFMKFMLETYPSQYDGKQVTELFKSHLPTV
jgi:uncharacterized protein YqeY